MSETSVKLPTEMADALLSKLQALPGLCIKNYKDAIVYLVRKCLNETQSPVASAGVKQPTEAPQ